MRALVTGCGSGFGRAVARRLLLDGAEVVATDPEPAGLAAALLEGLPAASRDAAAARLRTVAFDLRYPGHVRRVAEAAGDVDLLVNNAGYAVFAPQDGPDEWDRVRAFWDANVMGTARLTAAVLPGLRRRRGLVVQISSVAGRVTFAESGFYAAGKAALEALAEALYLENTAWGLRVAILRPGRFATDFEARAADHSPPRDDAGPHADHFAVWDAGRDAVLGPAGDPREVSEAVVAALHDPRPFFRAAVGADAEALLARREALGEDAFVREAAEALVPLGGGGVRVLRASGGRGER